MREIKFRAWDKDKKTMSHYNFLFTTQVMRFAGEPWDIDHLMQYTGLKDKNGKEIYEGDVVEIEGDYYGGPRWEVYYSVSRGGAEWGLRSKDGGDFDNGDYYHGDQIYWDKAEVIGNIYENPDLLSAPKQNHE